METVSRINAAMTKSGLVVPSSYRKLAVQPRIDRAYVNKSLPFCAQRRLERIWAMRIFDVELGNPMPDPPVR